MAGWSRLFRKPQISSSSIQKNSLRTTAKDRLIDAIKKYPEEDLFEFRQAIRQASGDLLAYRRKYTFDSRMEKRKNIQQVINTTIDSAVRLLQTDYCNALSQRGPAP